MLKFERTEIADLDDSIQALYKEVDGVYRLDVSGVPSGTGDAGKKAIAAERKAAKDAQAISKKYASLGKTPDEIEEILTAHAAAEESAAKKRGDFDAIRKQDTDKFNAERESWKSEKTALQSSERKAIIENSLVSALASAGFTDTGIDILPGIVAKRIKIETEDGVRVTTILQEDGATPLAGSAENGTATFADLAKELAVKYPELAMSSHKGGGAKPPGSRTQSKANQVSRTEFNDMNQSARAEHFKNGGSVVNA